MPVNLKQNKIYIISFFEGAAVMATELCGSKLISPYFGSSLYVWASVIAITLGSLAAGYFYGGKLSVKEHKSNILLSVLLSAALYMALMPFISGSFRYFAVGFPLISAVVVSSIALLMIPMFLMGAASPLIISIQSHEQNDSGKISGLVYSISTVGGIIATFFCGFWFIPSFGINITLIIFAALLAFSLLLLLQKKNNMQVLFVLIAISFLGFKQPSAPKNCIYEKDGILGKLNVLDDTIEIAGSGMTSTRKLLVNNIVQTELDTRTGLSLSEYVNILDVNTDSVSGGQALVLGLGGGVTSNLFSSKGYKVTGVELDERIIDIAKKYFALDPKVTTVCKDARQFINVCEDKFDLILMDLFKAEEQPTHVITVESLAKVKQMLSRGGQLIINWHGYNKGKRGLGTAVVVNTLKQQGFNCKFAAGSDNEDTRNIIIFASLTEPIVKKFETNLIFEPTLSLNTDNHPVLEKYNAEANQTWRKNYLQYYYSGR